MYRPVVAILVLLAGSACSSKASVPTPADGGPATDAAGPQACVPGRSEACTCTNGQTGAQACLPDGTYGACECESEADAGSVADAGRRLGPGDEGYPPRVVAACPDGSDRCCDDAPSGNLGCEVGLSCIRLSATDEPDESAVARSCLRVCESDTDCEASESNPLCREVRFGTDVCVSAAVQEGETANLSRVNGPLTGCSDDLSAGGTYLVGISRWTGSGLWELTDEQSTCVRQCDPNDPSDCTARAPHCTAPFFNSTERPGVCTIARSRAGAPCSRKDGTQQCSRNRTEDGRLVCWDYLGQYDDPTRGTCHQLCTLATQDCVNVHAPGQSPQCLEVLSSTITGLCSDGCQRHPENCAGTGSDRVGGQPGLGMNCTYGFYRDSGSTIDAPDLALCYDVLAPVLDIWDFTARGDSCRDNRNSCPDGAYCQSDGTTGDSYCVFGCNTSTTTATTGCESRPSPHDVCRKVNEDFEAGFCAPF